MRSQIAKRVVSLLTVSVVSILPVTIGMCLDASTARAQQASSGTQAKLDFSTEPSTVQKGSNTVRVKLTGAAGKPITGADVTVTFFMAAMPSMNMPAMKTTVTASEKGNGMYEGKGDLGSGGIWQVTISASKGGNVIATRKLTVKATGGM